MEEKKKKCPECGMEFGCLHSKDCWCMEYRLSKEMLDFLKKTYPDCLCPDCLSHYTDNKR